MENYLPRQPAQNTVAIAPDGLRYQRRMVFARIAVSVRIGRWAGVKGGGGLSGNSRLGKERSTEYNGQHREDGP